MAQVESVCGVPNSEKGTLKPAPGESVNDMNVRLQHVTNANPPERSEADTGDVAGTKVANSSSKMIAPAVRVEELREEDGHSSSSYLSVSDEEGGLSPGEFSDQEQAHSKERTPSKEFVPPTDELRDQIIKQVEFYFSDVNILKDPFLLKHVRRNKQGFVSVKLITSFRKVKKMTKDFRVVAYSLKQSEHLELNEEGSKVRRRDPLPDYDETTPSRTVVAVNLPIESPTVETVAELFTKCGDIALVRILKPGKPLPPDVKRHMNKHPELGTAVCAVIEFEHHDTAKKACDMMTNTEDWRKGLRVVLLAQSKKEKNSKTKSDKNEKVSGSDAGKTPISTRGEDLAQESDTSQLQEIANHYREYEEGTTRREDQMAVGNTKEKQESDQEAAREGHRQKKRRGRKGRVNDLVKGEVSGSSAASSGSEAEGVDTPSWRTHKKVDSGGGRTSLSPHHAEGNGGDIEGPDSASWRSRRRGSGGSFSGRASLSPHADPNRLSPCTTPRTTPRSSPKSSPRSSPRGSPVSRRRVLGKSPLATDAWSPGTSPKPSPSGSPEARRKFSAEDAGSLPSSPWVQRRLKAQQEMGSPLPGSSPVASPRLGRRMADMEGVIRQPHGPDGTKGFADGIGRGKGRNETT